MKKGLFISIEGGDGSGKTTACKEIYQELIDQGYDVIYTREPGGSDIAEQIRNVILDVNNTKMDDRTEALLYAASRRQHLVEIIMPALQANKIVLCDRFIDSSLAYQGYARGIGIDEVMKINEFAINNCMPDLTIYYNVEVETGLSRISTREALDRLDQESLSFHHKVHEGYNIVSSLFPESIKTIDANNDVQSVHDATYELVMALVKDNV